MIIEKYYQMSKSLFNMSSEIIYQKIIWSALQSFVTLSTGDRVRLTMNDALYRGILLLSVLRITPMEWASK